MTDETAKGLLSTTDAMVWAQEFCRIFNAHTIIGEAYEADKGGVPEHHVDEGTMVAWFANAIEMGRNAGRKETCPHSPEDQFTIADDMSSCRKCGEIFVEPSNG